MVRMREFGSCCCLVADVVVDACSGSKLALTVCSVSVRRRILHKQEQTEFDLCSCAAGSVLCYSVF
jgi:hypothetical protein